MDAVLSAYPIDYVKWDHNRDLLEAGSGAARRRAGRARADAGLLPRCSTRCASAHPDVAWESCASGGGRIDLGVARAGAAGLDLRHDRRRRPPADPALDQPAGRAGVRSARTSPRPPRTPPAARCRSTSGPPPRCSASFGIEWDLTEAADDDLDALAGWVAALQAVPAAAALRAGWSGRSRPTRPCCCTASSPPTASEALRRPRAARRVGAQPRGRGPGARRSTRRRRTQLAWEGPVAHAGTQHVGRRSPTARPRAPRDRRGARDARLLDAATRPETVTLVHVTPEV